MLTALIFAGIVVGVYLRKPSYESSAKVLISFEGLGISLSRAEFQMNNTLVQAVEAITSQGEILLSRSLTEQVIDDIGIEALRDPPPTSAIGRFLRGFVFTVVDGMEDFLAGLGLAPKLSERDKLVAKLTKSLSVFPVRQSQIIVVSVRWNKPEKAKLILQKIMDSYIAMNMKISQRANNYEIFAEQTKQLSAALNDAENVLLQFKLKNNLLDLPREKQTLASRIEKLSALIDGMTTGAGDANVAADDAMVTNDNAAVTQVTSLQSQLLSLKIELARMRVSATSENRAVKQLESQIAEVEKSIAGILSRVALALDESTTRLRTVNEAEAGYERIRRDVEMARDAYQTYRKVTDDRRAMQSRTMQLDVQVIDSPSLPVKASGPSRLVLLLAGLPFSILLAVGLVSLLFALRIWTGRENLRFATQAAND